MNPLDPLRYTRRILRAVSRGTLFPERHGPPLRPAPGGTTTRVLVTGRTELDRLELTDHVLPVTGLAAPLTLLHLSDVHLRGPGPWVDTLCGALAGLDADLVVLTGDILTRGYHAAVAAQFLAALPVTRLGTWSVIGNWEVWGGAPRPVWEDLLGRAGIELLHDRHVRLGPITLVGTDDVLSGHPDLDTAFTDLPPAPAVVLTHSPILFPRLVRAPVRLVLAGHTHAGQIRLPGVGPIFLPRGSGPYAGGWYEEQGVNLFVSRGIGWSLAPLRWRCPPEIARIHLVPESDPDESPRLRSDRHGA